MEAARLAIGLPALYSPAMTMSKSLATATLLSAILAFGLGGQAALAKDIRPADKAALPGVDGDHAIVQPRPEPDEALPAGQNGAFKIGNTDVRISGSIIVDIGTGSIRPPAH